MKNADIAIMSNDGQSLGQYRVDPGRHRGFRSSWPGSSRLQRTVRRWLDRWRQRRALHLLDDRMLKDIGLTRLDVEQEIEKPFWQP